ncbi:MAG TPA: VOC family protein [Acidimicrobiales bacterium]|nr:VOC family protein [Acidimicrobiales bacterium]
MEAPPIDGVSHFQLRVANLDASVAWYERALGLTELRSDPGRYVALQSTPGRFRVVLSAGGRAGSPGALDHIALAISDIDALTEWCEHLTAIGVPHEGIKANIAGQSVDLFDPDGNNIELISERKPDQRSEGRMT